MLATQAHITHHILMIVGYQIGIEDLTCASADERWKRLRKNSGLNSTRGDSRATCTRDGGLGGDLERDGSEASTEALDDPCTK